MKNIATAAWRFNRMIFHGHKHDGRLTERC